MKDKVEFIRTFFSDKVKEINFIQIDLDITDLSISDILRNINKTFPSNTRERNRIISGDKVVGVLCKSKFLDPMAGVILLICGNDTEINAISRNYILIGIDESKIINDDRIAEVLDNITHYMIKEFSQSVDSFNDFYIKYVYDIDSDEDYDYD